MKAKTLLIAAATLAVGAITSQAQVYSQNIVGYVNIPLVSGYNMVSVPVDSDGTGTNNTVISVLGTNVLANNSKVLIWTGSSFGTQVTYGIPVHQSVAVWNAPNTPLNPGQGFFVYNAGSPTNLTVVGTALVGTNLNRYVTGAGYNCVSSVTPLGGYISTNLQYTATLNDKLLTWDPVGQTYITYNYGVPVHQTLPVWSPSQPQLNVGQGFFIDSTNIGVSWKQILNP